MSTDRSTLKGYFVKGKKPLATQFAAWIDSFWHKDDSISMDNIENLSKTLNTKVDKIDGKSLSANDYTTTEKDKLAGIEEGANNLGFTPYTQAETQNAITEQLTALKDYVPDAGNTLNKLYSLISTLQSLVSSNDVNLDTVQEIVTFIKNNKDVIDSISTNKTNISDIVDNLLSTSINRPLSANQGRLLKGLIDNIQLIPGPQGETGATGNSGANGADGLSAYQVWLNAGNSGSVSDYLASLKGAKGDTGEQGIQGKTGEQGPQGLKGEQGATGASGSNGSDGRQGVDGLSAYAEWLTLDGNTGKSFNDFLASIMNAAGFNYNLIFSNATEINISMPKAWTITDVAYSSNISKFEYSLNGIAYVTISNGTNNISLAANTNVILRVTFATGKTFESVTISGKYN